MEAKVRDILETLKKEGLLKKLYIDLNVSSYNDLLLLVKRQIYSYIENLNIFLPRLFEICYGKPLREFNKFPLEVLLFFVYKKRQELQNCYPLMKGNNIYLRLKKIPSEKEYQNILNILSLIGVNIEKVYGFQVNYKDFLDSLKPIHSFPKKDLEKSKKESNIGTKPFLIGGGILILLSFFYVIFNLQSKNKEIHNLKKKVEEKNAEITDLELKLQNLKDVLNQKNLEIKDLQNNLKICSGKAEIANFKIKNLKNQLTELKHSISWLKTNLTNCRKELNKKISELEELNNKLNNKFNQK